MRFYLTFLSDNYGKKEIDEPFGMDALSFSLKQKEKGLARDISLTSGEAMFEFTHTRNHELKQLLYYSRKFGYEAVVWLTVELDLNTKLTFELDFAESETDDLEYIKCKGIQQGKFQLLKRRKETKVDVKSDLDIDGNFIGGLVPENMLLLAKPILQESKWSNVNYEERLYAKGSGNESTIYYKINPCQNILKSEIEDTLTSFYQSVRLRFNPPYSDFVLIKAKNNLQRIKIKITDLSIFFETDVDNGGNGYVDFQLQVRYGLEYGTANKIILLNVSKEEHQYYGFNGNLYCEIDYLNRDESIWVNFEVKVRQSTNIIIGPNPRFECFLKIPTMNIDIIAESIAYNSVSPSFRLIDVIKQVVKSTTGLSVYSPRFDTGGQFYDNRLLDGNFLRNIIDKSFSVSLEDIEKSITEMNGDFEIDSNGNIFFGIEEDFYKNIESGFFDNIQFSEMNKTFNPKYKVNEFRYKYSNYQSLKENEETNSADTIHGESRFSFFNKNVENKKEVEIEWTRDAFLIEENRRKALIIEKNTASQNDDTLFCIDAITTVFNNTFTESAKLSHSFNPTTNLLSLKSDGSLNFVSIGIQIGSSFIIVSPDTNEGDYNVVSVSNNTLELNGIGYGTDGDGVRQTKFTYTLEKTFIPFTNYTDQGFSETENLGSANSYSNRRYSIARNIYNYWQSYLATCNLYWKDKVIKNTWYKNNGNYTAKYNGVKLTEKSDFVPNNPILSPILYNDIIFSNVYLEDFILLQNNIRSQRGYIRTIDNNEQVIKIYPVDMEYKLLEKELIIKGEEKYEPTSMTILTEFDYILINNETRILSLDWDIKGEKLYVYDENKFRLYNGVYWFEVSINGAIAQTVEIFKEWMGLLN